MGIDIIKRSDGKFVCGYNIRFFDQDTIDKLYHSTDAGYSVEIFASEDEAIRYYDLDK